MSEDVLEVRHLVMRKLARSAIGAAAAISQFVYGFPMRAWAQVLVLVRGWPALGNMTRRKLRGLGSRYGGSANLVQQR